MYNKRSLSKDTKASKAPKSISKPKDIILDPMGQWKYPGQNTRIPGNDITMQGVNYPVLGVGSNGQKQMMYPGQDYKFQGADYVDEYPQMKKGGGLKSKKYSRDLEATNQVFHESPLFKKPKSKKKKIYHPKAKHYQEGGTPEDYDQFLSYSQTAPENRRPNEGYVYGDPNEYDHYGMWDALGKPQNFEQALETNPWWQPDEYDGSYHGFSVNPNTGIFLKSGKPGMKPGDTTWMEVKDHYLSDRSNSSNLTFNPDLQRFQYTPNENYIETELTPEEIQQYRDGGYIVEDLPKAQLGISDPAEFNYRNQMYSDSLYSYNWGKDNFAKINKTGLTRKGKKIYPESKQRVTKAQWMANMKKEVPGLSNSALEKEWKRISGKINATSALKFTGPEGTSYTLMQYDKPKQPVYLIKDEVPEPDFSKMTLPIKPINTADIEAMMSPMPRDIIQAPVRRVPNDSIVPPASKEIWKTLPDGTHYRVERPVDPRLTKPVKIGFYQKGGTRKSIGISDPKEYAYRKAAYDDSLWLYNENKGWDKPIKRKYDTPTGKGYLGPIKHTDQQSNKNQVSEIYARYKQADSPYFQSYNKAHPRSSNSKYKDIPHNDPIHGTMRHYKYDRRAVVNPFNGKIYGVTLPGENYATEFDLRADYKKPVQPVYLSSDKDKNKSKSKSKGNKSKGKDTWNHVKEKVVTEPEDNFEDVRLPILPPKIIERQYPDEIIQRTNYTVYPREAGDIVPPQSKEIWVKGVDGQPYRIERPVDPRLTKPVKVGFYQEGGRTYDGYDPEFDPYAGAPLTDREKLSCFIPPQPEDYDDGIIPYYALKRYSDWYSNHGYEIKPPMRPEVVMTPRPIDKDALDPKYAEETPTWNFKAPQLDLPLKVREDHKGEQVGTTKQPIYETRVVPTMGADGIYRNVYKQVIVGYQDVQGMQYHNEEPTFHNLETGSSSGYKEGGALLTKKVTCKKCGWKWDAADGGDDITTCHKCGGQGLIHAQKGGVTMGQEVDLTPAQEAHLRKLGYKLERI